MHIEISTGASYCVEPTGTQYTNLEPVALMIGGGAFHFQDYLTADQADALADALKATAAQVRESQVTA